MAKQTGFRWPSFAEKKRARGWLDFLEKSNLSTKDAQLIAAELAYAGVEVPDD